MIWAFFAVSVLASIWIWTMVWEYFVKRKITIEVDVVRSTVDLGDHVVIQCRIINRSWFPCPNIRCTIQLPDQIDSGNTEHPNFSLFQTYLMPRQQTTVTLHVLGKKRGHGHLGKANFTLHDGLGLRRVFHSTPIQAEVIVRPKRMQSIPVPLRMLDLMGEVRILRFFNEDPSLLQGIRPYQDGDPLRYVSWYATARTQQLMVKEFGHTTTSRCLLVLSGDIQGDVQNRILDILCERTIQLSEYLLGVGFSVGLYTNMFDSILRDFYQRPSSAPEQLEKIRNRLGSLGEIPFVNLQNLLNVLPKLVSHGDMIIVLTGRLDNAVQVALSHLQRFRGNLFVYAVLKPGEQINSRMNVQTFVEEAPIIESTSKIGS